jgi:hypothetical protein
MTSQYEQGRSDHRNGKVRARNIWRVALNPLRLPYYLGIVSSLLAHWATRISLKVAVPLIYLRLLAPSGSPTLIADTSLIILTPNLLSRRTRFCLRSVLKYEIPQEILVFQTNKDFSYSSGVNRGIRASTTRNIVLLNDDCFVKDKWLSSLLRLAESKPELGIVGSKLLHPNGQTYCTEGYMTAEGRMIQAISMPETAHSVRGLLGCAMLIKKKTITDIGLFDEAYSPFLYEDTDFCYRARLKGWQVYYCPESQVYHISGATLRKKLEEEFVKSVEERNKPLFLERWGELMKKGAV